ncbi:hypothetical protein V5799_024189 [Amblyomma americanum]|uniref:Uncharacterized protein n=1 Tax=Amblyomma americanum TaxID=6943 RepID=A0AAQ4ED97_AMBAM
MCTCAHDCKLRDFAPHRPHFSGNNSPPSTPFFFLGPARWSSYCVSRRRGASPTGRTGGREQYEAVSSWGWRVCSELDSTMTTVSWDWKV